MSDKPNQAGDELPLPDDDNPSSIFEAISDADPDDVALRFPNLPELPEGPIDVESLSDSERFARVKEGETHIAVWGTTQSGKTTFLATLYSMFTDPRYAERFKGLQMDTGNIVAVDWIMRVFIPMFNDGIFPDATAIVTTTYPMFIVSSQETGKELFRLTFIDGPGEMFRDPDAFARANNLPNPLDYLRDCAALIMLIDPTLAVKGDPNDELEALVKNLYKLRFRKGSDVADGPKLRKPVAFCLTKCDEVDHRPALEDKDRFLNEYFGRLMMNLGNAVIERGKAQWYATSALGFHDDSPTNTYLRWNTRLGIRDVNLIEPINVGEPLIWAMEKLGLLP